MDDTNWRQAVMLLRKVSELTEKAIFGHRMGAGRWKRDTLEYVTFQGEVERDGAVLVWVGEELFIVPGKPDIA